MANVNYAGRVYQLPLIVSEQPDIDNLLGRRWLPALHLDWNRIFHCIGGAPQFQPESDNHRQLALKMTDTSYSTDHYYVNVNVQGIAIRMMLDTGATNSDINLAQWKLIGKPRLKTTRLQIVDAAKNALPLEGVCMVKVKYCGQEALLPLVVTSDPVEGTIGTNWFEKIQFDFNSIFDHMIFPEKPKSQL